MVTVYDVDTQELLKVTAEELKKNQNIKPPEWSAFVKTGAHKEKAPDDKDWWYQRVASVLRKCYIKPVGVERLRTVYGGRKNRGYKPERTRKAGGNIIRKALQQLETAGLIEKCTKGRKITGSGMKLLDNTAYKVHKSKPAKVITPEAKTEKPESKKEDKPQTPGKENSGNVKKEEPKIIRKEEIKETAKTEEKPKDTPKKESPKTEEKKVKDKN